MKRSVLTLLAVSMLGLSAAACSGGDDADENVPPVEENVNTQPAPAPAPMTPDTGMAADTMMMDTMGMDTTSM